MTTAKAQTQRQQLDAWFVSPQGRHLWRRERDVLTCALASSFGHHGLEVGTPDSSGSVLRDCSLGHRIRLDLNEAGRLSGSFHGNLDALAIRPRSLAVIVLIHVLEYLPAPAAALASLAQALAPGGRLVVACFDAISAPALRARLHADHLPWWPRGACSARRCSQWLRGFQLDPERLFRTGRVPLNLGDRWQRRLDWLDRVAPRWPMGSVYVISARKRERQGTAIRLGDKLPGKLVAPGVPRPTSSRVIEDSAA